MNKSILETLVGDYVLMEQYTDMLDILIQEESWTHLRVEMEMAMPRTDRVSMPGLKSASILKRPNVSITMNETPVVIVRLEGLDGKTYDWEASLHLCDNSRGFVSVGHLHLISEPDVEFEWKPTALES